MIRLKERYNKEIKPALMKKFNYKNINEVPKIEKVVLNIGVGEAKGNLKMLAGPVKELTKIAGQKAVITRAKKSISNFKLREDMAIGCKVTLRQAKMYFFLDKLLNIVIPRIKDFRGIKRTSFDGRGNFAMGLKEQTVFPEIGYDEIDEIRGMDICITTTARTDEEARELLNLMGMPFKKK